MKKLSILLISFISSCFSIQVFANIDVALGKTVTENGTFGTSPGSWTYYPPAAGSTLTDGILEPETELWNANSVWWNGSENPNNEILIDLGSLFKIDSFTVQADDNDTYRVEYRIGAGSWTTAFDVPTMPSWGLVTRSIDLATPIYADALRFTATGGDGYYAVSEIEAWGDKALSSVPEPQSLLLLLSGLAALACVRRRNSKQV